MSLTNVLHSPKLTFRCSTIVVDSESSSLCLAALIRRDLTFKRAKRAGTCQAPRVGYAQLSKEAESTTFQLAHPLYFLTLHSIFWSTRVLAPNVQADDVAPADDKRIRVLEDSPAGAMWVKRSERMRA